MHNAFVFGEAEAGAVRAVLSGYPPHPRYLLAILQDVQRGCRHIPKEAMEIISGYLGVPASRVYAMVTFYGALSLTPRGERTVRVCMGTACHLRMGGSVLEAFRGILGVAPGDTSEDGKYTLETVSCLGACALAPVVMVEERTYGSVKPSEAAMIIKRESSL